MSGTDTSTPNRPSSVRGRPFLKGNPGRKVGATNRVTRVLAALIDGEAEALLRKGIEIALAGDPQMLKFFLGRLLPRERRIELDLPEDDGTPNTPVAIADAILQAVVDGKISPNEGLAVAAVFKVDSDANEARRTQLQDAITRRQGQM